MSALDLLEHPVCKAEELGAPIPPSAHATSVALPRWQDVVGYEEKKPAVINRLRSGYPRFVILGPVQELARRAGADQPCLPFPSPRVARLCVEFIQRTAAARADVVTSPGVSAVVASQAGADALRAFWQHTGLIVSSRQAQALLDGRTDRSDASEIRQSLRQQLADLYGCATTDVFLAPTGMAAVFAALQVVSRRSPNRPSAQIGFPYVDTLKLQQKLGAGGILLHRLAGAAAQVEALLKQQELAAAFCELPSNPLLGSPNLPPLSTLLRRHGVPLVVDDVVATPINVDLMPYADLVVTSLTKFIVGTGEAMGGALICNPCSPFYADLKAIVRAQHEELLWGEDAQVLDAQARSFPDRMRRHNHNALRIAEKLRAHSAVEQVWYPKWERAEAYEAVRRPTGGWGGLLSFLPKSAPTRAAAIYDRMSLCKGPSLGTVFSLACPFTLLAHYSELDWAESCGVSRYLIRLSVGLEDPEELWGRLEQALGA